jgi:hypothetical protein
MLYTTLDHNAWRVGMHEEYLRYSSESGKQNQVRGHKEKGAK